ncbi:hypothetical protein L198_04124 [Cryptococcus wingfieldii CBS 7118]|uniref:Uncharacterized protein n=1 Tax=Cryptococcus wingfieldii CBS 7118 TaxID=1295528 RepID=A0A1E3J6C2_9TREE|nr:hypothetical protein L198_04124 [Cryptococcus wingfieldii CBS 7118]ODN96410.1 hypothetical protein L198_04124 [Cryptococcus wingfieldii CBS 7118]
MAPLPFHLSLLLRPLSPPVATTRLKANIFALFLFAIRNLFPPYQATKSLLVSLSEKLEGTTGRQQSWGEAGVNIGEGLLAIVLVWNTVEAFVALQYPSTYVPPHPKTMNITPASVSSPLTRPYSPQKSCTPTQQPQVSSRALPSSASFQTPSSTPLRQAPTQAHQLSQSTSHPLSSSTSSNLSSSTARILNLPVPESPSNGLFYERKSPVKAGAAAGAVGGVGGDFVLVDRDEKEWVDNVWKGVRGKGGKLAL